MEGKATLTVKIYGADRDEAISILTDSGLKFQIEKVPDQQTPSEKHIAEFLIDLGMSTSLQGYLYIKQAIILVLKDPTYLRRNVTLKLYPAIATEYETKASRVERAIRHAVTAVFERGNLDELNELFANNISEKTGNPTNSEFIARIAEKLKQ